MTKQDKIDELEAALARAKGEAKQWEERCALSWELRETAEKEHDAEIEKLNLSIDNLKFDLTKCKAESEEVKTKFETPQGNRSTAIELVNRKHELEELKEANKLYIKMLSRLLKQIADLEEKLNGK